MTADAYTLLDFGNQQRLEQWGPVRTVRPDPRALSSPTRPREEWADADAVFEGRVGQGQWRTDQPASATWVISHGGLRFEVKLAPSMHTGLFPEQAAHWDWLRRAAAGAAPAPEVLNLFAYTGGASLALAALGCRVTHVDASKPALAWAKRNAALNHISTIRWIEDDVRTFVRRERQRGRSYGGLLLDPPAFGRTRGAVWRLEHDLEPLLRDALTLLTPDARFVLINAYDLSTPAYAIGGMLGDLLDAAAHPLARGSVEAATLGLHAPDGRTLPTGVYARVSCLQPEV
jgi:23S rRNA (cytosine1962-C5)-methyltransferase